MQRLAAPLIDFVLQRDQIANCAVAVIILVNVCRLQDQRAAALTAAILKRAAPWISEITDAGERRTPVAAALRPVALHDASAAAARIEPRHVVWPVGVLAGGIG